MAPTFHRNDSFAQSHLFAFSLANPCPDVRSLALNPNLRLSSWRKLKNQRPRSRVDCEWSDSIDDGAGHFISEKFLPGGAADIVGGPFRWWLGHSGIWLFVSLQLPSGHPCAIRCTGAARLRSLKQKDSDQQTCCKCPEA
jgi:hypothetical protein